MKFARFLLWAAWLTLSLSHGSAQAGEPKVVIHRHSAALAYLMYPEFYRAPDDAQADTTWQVSNLDSVVTYWELNGKALLRSVSELSGVPWSEKELHIYLVEEAPTWGSWDPFVFPVDNWRRGDVVQLGPRGDGVGFVMAHLLTQRLFEQVPPKGQPKAFRHPLFQPGMGTRDVLANLVAYWTMAALVGDEKALALAASSGFAKESPGMEFMVRQFAGRWVLTKKKPLVRWVEEEPEDSDLVKEALSLREKLVGAPVEGRRSGWIERSRIGLRVRTSPEGDVVVVAVQSGKMAEVSGLQPGDILTTVGDVAVRSSRDVMARLIGQLRAQGVVHFFVERDGDLEERVMDMAWIQKRKPR